VGEIGAPLADYEGLLTPARKRFEGGRTTSLLLSTGIPKELLEDFLLLFCAYLCCAYEVRITQPVEGWIRRAGERCIELRFEQLGESLLVHSKQEADRWVAVPDARGLGLVCG
jgi:hypothetical protein